MASHWLFVINVIVFCIVTILLTFGTPSKAINRLTETKRGKGILKGVFLFCLFGIFFALVFPSDAKAEEPPVWFTYSEVYLGLDRTKNMSNFCHSGGDDDRLTSNGGLRQNVYRSLDRRFHWNLKYTHHSCAFSEDRPTYDAFGVEMVYRFYSR